MKFTRKDLFASVGKVDVLCITTNCMVNKAGQAIMGKGIAFKAKKRWPICTETLGKMIQQDMCSGQIHEVSGTKIYAFPTKIDWRRKSSLNLIKESAINLRALADIYNWKYITLPPPGCGNGDLNWQEVKTVLEDIFDDRFIICFGKGK
jgi:hypothetical protein